MLLLPEFELSLSTDVQAALQDLSGRCGHSFAVQDARGRTAIVSGGNLKPGLPSHGIFDAGMKHSVKFQFPNGEPGCLSLILGDGDWNSSHEAWVQAGACLMTATVTD